MTITAAVDGSALGNPGPAGWAWVVSGDCWDAGGWDHGTNNLGELTAVLELLRATRLAGLSDQPLHVLADSQYAINVISKWRHGWKKRGWAKADKKPIKNLDVIKELDTEMAGRTVDFEWVRGHTGHPMNELADDLARGAAEAHQAGRTPAPGPGFGTSAPRAAGTPADSQTSTPGRTSHSGAADTPTDLTGSTTSHGADATANRTTRGGGADATSDVAGPRQSAPSDTPTAGPAASAGATGSADGGSATSSIGQQDIVAVEKRLFAAWTSGDAAALGALTAPGFTCVLPDGTVTPDLIPATLPTNPRHSAVRSRQVGPSGWLTCYRVRSAAGDTLESTVWQVEDGIPLAVWHQATPIS